MASIGKDGEGYLLRRFCRATGSGKCQGWRAAPHRTQLAVVPTTLDRAKSQHDLRPSRKKEMQMKIHLTWIRATAAAAIAVVGSTVTWPSPTIRPLRHNAIRRRAADLYAHATLRRTAAIRAPQQQYAAPQAYAAQQPYAAPQQQYPTTQYPQTAAYGTPGYGAHGSCSRCLHHAARPADGLHAASPATVRTWSVRNNSRWPNNIRSNNRRLTRKRRCDKPIPR